YKQTFPYPSPFISLHKQQSRLFPPPFPPLSHQPFLLPLSLQPCVSPIMALTKLTTKLLFVAILGLLAFTQVGHAQFFNGTVGGDGDGEGGDGGDYGEVAAGGGRGAPTKEALVPAMFIFGDSLIDNGNNNNLASLAKANYLPYGIDFNGGPTGRFSNGYTMVDEIAEQLGLPLIPPYTEATNGDVTRGVNYASAAAGILDDTGRNFVGRIPFDQQIGNFRNTLDQLTGKLGAVETAQGIGRSIFFVGMGSNDYLNNYLMPNYPTRGQYNGQQYADLLVHQECCIAGFSVVNRGCCGIGRNAGQITCLPFQTPCNERGQYVFWDAFHPTEAVNVLMGRKAFNGDTTYVYPINIEQLARIG
ncbi:unnamed protein product, partial [Linum tenue]